MKNPISVLPPSVITGRVRKATFPIWLVLFLLFGHPEENLSLSQSEIAKAKKETVEAFQRISNNLQRGIQVIEHLKHFETTRNKIMKP
ncbi:MAG: hypothetical protein AAGD17_06180 [Bacteroidota bacterium]